MPKLLSKDEVAGYRDRGYHFPIDALSAGEVADFRRKLEDYEAESGGPIKADMRHRSHVLFTWIDEMVRHPKILDAIEDLLGAVFTDDGVNGAPCHFEVHAAQRDNAAVALGQTANGKQWVCHRRARRSTSAR